VKSRLESLKQPGDQYGFALELRLDAVDEFVFVAERMEQVVAFALIGLLIDQGLARSSL
jgi:hypothetical protein